MASSFCKRGAPTEQSLLMLASYKNRGHYLRLIAISEMESSILSTVCLLQQPMVGHHFGSSFSIQWGPETIAKLTHIAWILGGYNEPINEGYKPTQLYSIGII